ncbi:MAG: Nif3-like dinuclear metal center hexameric protein [Solirubrobacteraceae bacterium]
MTVSTITNYLEELANLKLAENFDNVGLLIGSLNASITGVLITLDVTEEVIDEAIKNNLNLIITYHPIIFKGLKTLKSDDDDVQRIAHKSILNNINIYAIHTNLDNIFKGVNYQIGKKLKLKNYKILIPKGSSLLKLTTYVPINYLEKVKDALFNAGAGELGDYKNCSFNVKGMGSFKPLEGSTPFLGEINTTHFEEGFELTMVLTTYKEKNVIAALLANHPYEEIAYQITELKNLNKYEGSGGMGELEYELTELEFLKNLKYIFNNQSIRHSKLLNKKIKKIAFIGGSGSFGMKEAISLKADVFITADLKYHQFFEADNKILLIDIGHFESEQFTKELLKDYLKEKFNKFAILESKINTNPVFYY